MNFDELSALLQIMSVTAPKQNFKYIFRPPKWRLFLHQRLASRGWFP